MRALEVVMVDEPADAALGIAQVDEDGALDALAPEGAPEAFDLAQGLRMARGGHDLLDAAFVQLLAEGALATPGDILRAVVGEHLFRRAMRSDGRAQDFEHQRGGLTGVQAVADEEAAMIVHEGDQVDAAILAFEDEGEQVGLPELVGAGAFETADLV